MYHPPSLRSSPQLPPIFVLVIHDGILVVLLNIDAIVLIILMSQIACVGPPCAPVMAASLPRQSSTGRLSAAATELQASCARVAPAASLQLPLWWTESGVITSLVHRLRICAGFVRRPPMSAGYSRRGSTGRLSAAATVAELGWCCCISVFMVT